jgi:hypothetical protein
VESCLHWSLVNQHSVQFFGGLRCGFGLEKGDVCNATAGTILIVADLHTLDWADRLGEVFLRRSHQDQYFVDVKV